MGRDAALMPRPRAAQEVVRRAFECAEEVDELLCRTVRETLEAFREPVAA